MLRLLTQGVAVASIGLITHAARLSLSPKIHPRIGAHPLIAEHEALSLALSSFIDILPESTVGEMLRISNMLLLELSSNTLTAPHNLNRLSAQLVQIARSATKLSGLSYADYDRVVDVREEFIPRLQQVLDDIMWNFLLDRQ